MIENLRASVAAKIKVDDNGCWLWTGWKHNSGYGYVNLWPGPAPIRVHRYVYEQLIGPIPDGLVLDHLCRVRHCVNPAHLEPVTRGENVRRGAAVRDTCKNGHPWTGDVDHRGHRKCLACRREAYWADAEKNRQRARISARRRRKGEAA